VPTWKILGQDDATSTGLAGTSTGRELAYQNGTTDGVIAWSLITNRSTDTNAFVRMFVSTSTSAPDVSMIINAEIPFEDTLETPRFTMSTGDAVLWTRSATDVSISVFGAEGVSTG
jgi:hypothetical protein